MDNSFQQNVASPFFHPMSSYLYCYIYFPDKYWKIINIGFHNYPKDFELRLMDKELLERSVWYEDNMRVHGSAENFLSRCLGVCLLHHNTIVCEASTGAAILGTRELGVYTKAEYRKQDFATITCEYLIRMVEQAGQQTYWNCASSNIASATLARKLGYQVEKEYQLRGWNKLEA